MNNSRPAQLEAIREAIEAGNYKAAITSATRYLEAQYGKDRSGMVVHPSPADLGQLMRVRPGILGNVSVPELDALRVPAAMLQLGLSRSGIEWLPDGFTLASPLKPAVAVRMLLFSAAQARDMRSYRASGVKSVRILGVSAPDAKDKFSSCETCWALNNTVWPLASLPELPYPQCTHTLGCRCATVAEFHES